MLFSIGRGVCLWTSWTAFITIRHVVLNVHNYCLHSISKIYVNHQAEPPPHDTDWSFLWCCIVRGVLKSQGRGKTGQSRSVAEEHGNSKMFIGKLDFACNTNVTAPFISNGPCTRSPTFLYAFFRIRHPFLSKCLLRMRKQKIEPDPNYFSDGRKFWRQCVNVIDTT